MGDFLAGSRRKAGLLILILALVFTSQWLSSILPPPSLQFRLLFDRDDYTLATLFFSHTNHTIDRLSSKKACIVWETFHAESPLFVTTDTVGLWINSTDTYIPDLGNDEEIWNWKWRWCGFAVGEYHSNKPFALSVRVRRIPYWSTVMPLTLLAAYLLLTKSGKANQKKSVEPVSELPA